MRKSAEGGSGSGERPAERSARRIIAVGAGAGGCGKSLLAANLAVFLGTLGKRVVAVDVDKSRAQLPDVLGVERPLMTVADYFDKRILKIEDAVVDTGISDVGLATSERQPLWVPETRPHQPERILEAVAQLDADYVVLDLGSGDSFEAVDALLAADLGIVVSTPEPSALEATYRLLKVAFLRHLGRLGLERAIASVEARARAFEGGVPGPADLYAALREQDPVLAGKLLEVMRRFRLRFVLSQARSKAEQELGAAVAMAVRRRLGILLDTLGALEHDDAAWMAAKKRRPVVVDQPESRLANGIERVARRVAAMESGELTGPILRVPESETFYELLEVEPGASEEDLRRAYRRIKEVYGPDSIVIYGLYDADRLASLQLRFEEAYDTLMDPERRKAYDVETFPEGLPAARRKNVTPTSGVPAATRAPAPELEPGELGDDEEPEAAFEGDLPPEPELSPDTEFSGPLLRQIRESRGIDLHSISHKTKIGVGHLRAIEDERFDIMPATVYVRGFLTEYAKFLRLDVNRVLNTYLPRLKTARPAERQ